MNDPVASLNQILTNFQNTIVIPFGTPPNTQTPSGISIANGYSYNLPAENVYTPAQQDVLNSNDPAVFPKILFTVDGGNLSLGASRRVLRTARLSVMVIIQEANLDTPAIADKPLGWTPVGTQVRNLKDDIENTILGNMTLGRTVDRCVPSDFETDSNFQYPNGVIVVWADVSWMNNE